MTSVYLYNAELAKFQTLFRFYHFPPLMSFFCSSIHLGSQTGSGLSSLVCDCFSVCSYLWFWQFWYWPSILKKVLQFGFFCWFTSWLDQGDVFLERTPWHCEVPLSSHYIRGKWYPYDIIGERRLCRFLHHKVTTFPLPYSIPYKWVTKSSSPLGWGAWWRKETKPHFLW